jgi:hypothetical protein
MNGEDRFDENEVYDILRNERRRHVLRFLRRNGTTTTIGDLADAIAEAETGESPPPSDTRQSVYVSLHQTHLPKLDNLGVIEYDRDERTVQLREAATEILSRLDMGEEEEIRETAERFALAIVAIAVVGLLLTVAAVFAVPASAPAAAGLTLVAVVGVAGYYYRRFDAAGD